MDVYCSYCSNLRSPWYCPHCDQTSTRRWNVSTHIKRKHPRQFNPYDLMKKIAMTDSYYERRTQTFSDSSNSIWPRIDWSDLQQITKRSAKVRNLLEESTYLSKIEQMDLLIAIYNQMQSK